MEEYQKVMLEKYLAELRLLVDPHLIAKYPSFAEKPYPLGRCKEIRNAILELLLERLAIPIIPKPLQVLERKIRLGHTLKPVWGSLRDEYFQNAILIDDWYIDAANDTVNPNKPRVEILKLQQSGFSAITSFEQFCLIARKYWQVSIYKNDVYPAIAPFLPLLCVNEKGACWLGAANDDMIALARCSQFTLSERILTKLSSTPSAIKQQWYAHYANLNNPLLEQHSLDPVEFCQRYRNEQKDQDLSFRDDVVKSYLRLAQGVSSF
ncbi:hypothetical protein A7985_16000 [Pseudoalteromonas luteoviolacea]|uniref:Uncharacterized protein n=1 Tax=Pseudoalteromonas luteoviolacea TaxID=43657 RepID=A0A1C0TNZ6_9GAMM|nr:hypothetical protein [Pseudoalteromonas luteoviolacea]OCQ20535.1 hypothetical protein A7985_16000 [Pseudoalteromonas luteoviolacea]